jgi:dipeptidyl aminopeptidase/acylaminoacyl peptidase
MTMRHLVAILAMTASCAARAAAQSPRPPDAALWADLVVNEMTFDGAPALSPDGRWVAYATQNNEAPAASVGDVITTASGLNVLVASSTIRVTDTRTGATRNLTAQWETSWAPSWSPDGKHLAFFSDHNGPAHLVIWHRERDEMQELPGALVQPSHAWETPRWTPDGTRILYIALPAGVRPSAETMRLETPRSLPAGLVELRESEAARAARTGQPARSPEASNRVLLRPLDVAMADPARGEVTRLAHGNRIMNALIAPDAHSVAIVANARRETAGSQQDVVDLFIVPLPARESAAATASLAEPAEWHTDGRPGASPAWEPLVRAVRMSAYALRIGWSPDSTRLAFCTDGQLASGDIYLVTVRTGSVQNLTEHVVIPSAPASGKRLRRHRFESVADPPLWTPDGRMLVAVGGSDLWAIPTDGGVVTNLTPDLDRGVATAIYANTGATALVTADNAVIAQTVDADSLNEGLCRVPLHGGRLTQLWERPETYGATFGRGRFAFDVATSTGAIVSVIQNAHSAGDLWLTDRRLASPRRITDLNPQLHAFDGMKSELLSVRLADGRTSRAGLLLPAGATVAHPVPMIVWPHDAGRSASANQLGAVGQLSTLRFISHGFAVLFPDLLLERGNPLSSITSSLLPAVEAASATGLIDRDRIGIFGNSFGGYIVNATVTQTSRFKAAVAFAGIADLTAYYLSDEGFFGWTESGMGRMQGTLWQYPQRYVANSPIFHLDTVQTPLLLFYGDKDLTAPEQARAMYLGLVRLGKEAMLVGYRDGAHNWDRLSREQRDDFWERTLRWFDDHFAPRAH